MRVSVEDAGPCRRALRVEAGADEVREEYNAVVAEIGRMARVPGFRKGKAPARVVEGHYAGAISETMRERLIPRLYRQALTEQAIAPVAVVDVGQVAFGKGTGLAFTATIDVPPDFKLSKYRRLAAVRRPVAIADEEVGKAMDRLLDAHARFEDDDAGRVADGALVRIDYRGTLADGAPVSDRAPQETDLHGGTDFWALIGPRELAPGFNAGLTGAAVGETRSIAVAFPDDFHVEALRGAAAMYEVTVKGIRMRRPPELTEAFLKPFEAPDAEALRAKIRAELERAAEHTERDRVREQIGAALLEKCRFDVPESVVMDETRTMVRSIVERIAMQGATREQIEERQGQIVEHATKASRERVRLTYILARIADAEDVRVDDAEVDARIAAMAAGYGMTTERLRAELEKNNALERIRSDIRNEKAMEIVTDNAKIKERAVKE